MEDHRFLSGKLAMSMAMFNGYLSHYQSVYPTHNPFIIHEIKGPDNPTCVALCVALCVRKTGVKEKEGDSLRHALIFHDPAFK